MNKEKILVTGGAGFFGGHICEYFINDNKNVVLVDVLNSETTKASYKNKTLEYLIQLNQKNKNSAFSYYICDITNEVELTKIIINEKPTIVIHAAALVMDRASVNLSLEFINVNVLGTQILINALSQLDTVKKIIFISSRSAVGEVDGAQTEMYEEDSFRPVNPYGASKASAEHFFYSFHHIHKVPITILRMNPMYGPRCRHDMFVWRILNSIISGQQIEKYGSGEAVRDWLYVKDAVKAISKDFFKL
jgi:nucleoside-diphosphate-sugar epimerase